MAVPYLQTVFNCLIRGLLNRKSQLIRRRLDSSLCSCFTVRLLSNSWYPCEKSLYIGHLFFFGYRFQSSIGLLSSSFFTLKVYNFSDEFEYMFVYFSLLFYLSVYLFFLVCSSLLIRLFVYLSSCLFTYFLFTSAFVRQKVSIDKE